MAITNNAAFHWHFDGADFSESAQATVEQGVLPMVTITKRANPTIVYPGDKVTYFVTIVLNDFTGEITGQRLVDTLPPELEFVPGSLTIDAEPSDLSPEDLPLDFAAGGEHLLVYQCLVR